CSKAETPAQAPQPQEPQVSQSSYATANEAVEALVAAVEKGDAASLQKEIGPDTDELVHSGDDVADKAARDAFVERYRQSHQLVAGGPNDLVLQVGDDGWPLPIPLVKEAGKWRFDGAAGVDEVIRRRIGGNELRTIDVMRGYVDAQEDYAAEARDG